jgi:hypothetical protein
MAKKLLNDGRCNQMVHSGPRTVTHHRCTRAALHGQRFCKQHLAWHATGAATVPLWVLPSARMHFEPDCGPERVMVRELGDCTFTDNRGVRRLYKTDWQWYYRTEAEAVAEWKRRVVLELASARDTVRRCQRANTEIAKIMSRINKGRTRG